MQAHQLFINSLVCLSILLLNACGFHLKGHASNQSPDQINSHIENVSLNGNLKFSELATAIKQEAELANIAITSDSDVQINILKATEEDTRMGGTQGADIEQYRLKLTANWQLNVNGSLLFPRPISAQQMYDYLPSNQLANDQERQIIRKELEQQLASNILRQALTIANNPPKCDCNEAETRTTQPKS